MTYVPNAASDAAKWYGNLMRSRLPNNAFPFKWADAVNHIIGTDRPENVGKPFAQILTEAWTRGIVPDGFTKKADTYFEDMQRRKAKYLAAVEEHGAAAVHEGRVRWLAQ